jgi:hypothetical protein
VTATSKAPKLTAAQRRALRYLASKMDGLSSRKYLGEANTMVLRRMTVSILNPGHDFVIRIYGGEEAYAITDAGRAALAASQESTDDTQD